MADPLVDLAGLERWAQGEREAVRGLLLALIARVRAQEAKRKHLLAILQRIYDSPDATPMQVLALCAAWRAQQAGMEKLRQQVWELESRIANALL